jgi:hypothetical protein
MNVAVTLSDIQDCTVASAFEPARTWEKGGVTLTTKRLPVSASLSEGDPLRQIDSRSRSR